MGCDRITPYPSDPVPGKSPRPHRSPSRRGDEVSRAEAVGQGARGCSRRGVEAIGAVEYSAWSRRLLGGVTPVGQRARVQPKTGVDLAGAVNTGMLSAVARGEALIGESGPRIRGWGAESVPPQALGRAPSREPLLLRSIRCCSSRCVLVRAPAALL